MKRTVRQIRQKGNRQELAEPSTPDLYRLANAAGAGPSARGADARRQDVCGGRDGAGGGRDREWAKDHSGHGANGHGESAGVQCLFAVVAGSRAAHRGRPARRDRRAKGLRAAVQAVFGVRGIVQRCQWHKRENVVRYLPRAHQAAFRRKLQAAYERPTYDQARRPPSKVDGFRNTGDRINTIRVDFRVVNETDSGHPKTDEAQWMRFTLDTVGRTGWPRDPQGRPIYPEGFEELVVKRGKPLHPRLRTTAGRSRVLPSRFARTHRKVRRPRFPATRRAVDRVQQRTSTTGRAKTFAR